MQIKPTEILSIFLPSPKTIRGQNTFIQAGSTHLLYFNGCTVILRPYNNDLPLYINHNFNVAAVKYSNDYKYIASIDEKGTLLIHQHQKTKLVQTKSYQNCFSKAKCLDWTADNKKLCIVGSGKNKYGRIINIDTGIDSGDVSAITKNLITCAFKPIKPFKLAVAGEEFITKFYDGPPYKFVLSDKSHTNYVNQIKFSPNGNKLITVGSDRKIVLYDGSSCQKIKQLGNAHQGSIMGVVWLDNSFVVTAGHDKKVKKWNQQFQSVAQLKSSNDQNQFSLIDSFVVGVTYAVEKESVFFVVLSGEIKQTDKDLTKIIRSYEGHASKPIKVIPLSFENQALLLDTFGKILKINIKSSQVERYNRNNICYNKMLLDAAVSEDGIAYILNAEQEIFLIDTDITKTIQNKQFIKVDGAKLLTTVNGFKGFICYTRTHVKVYGYKDDRYQQFAEAKLSNQPTAVFSQPSTPCTIFIGNQKGRVQIFRIQIAEQQIKIQKISQYQSNPRKIASIRKHNNIIFTGDSMGSIKVFSFSAEQSQPHKISDNMGSHTSQISSIIVKNNLIYSFSLDNKYSVWKLDNFTRITTINDTHKQGIIFAQIVEDKVVSCGGDLLVKVYEV